MKDRGRYTSRSTSLARTAAQLLVMKPFVWRTLSVEVHGENLIDDLEGSFVVVANHSSHFDTPLIYGALPRRIAQFLAAGAAADYFFDKWWKAAPTALLFNAFPVDRKGTRARKGMAGSLLTDGVPLLLYPEGTRSRNGAMGPFKPGTAALCISRNVPAVPIAIVGAYAAWPHNQARPVEGRPPVHVVIGRPMMANPGEIAHQFNERIRRQVIELHDSTARAYGMKTLADYAVTAAIGKARNAEIAAEAEAGTEPDDKRTDGTTKENS
ncbi:MAG TPA: lysophospholipid acyltransferase family protein [Propionibacteriaceae bacterium]|nr:lysophospholipid acyltransferase family protein [Propionibacteriaceae bacterium]